jgi:hypothetical protein
LQYFRLLQRDEAALHHLVQDRQKSIDLFLAVDDLDDDRKVLGKVEQRVPVQTARMAKAERTA